MTRAFRFFSALLVLLFTAVLFAQESTPPLISGAFPDKLEQGKLSQEVKITGSGFKSGLSITFSKEGVNLDSITQVDPLFIKCLVSVSQNAQPDKVDVTVKNSTGEACTGVAIFSVISKPAISMLSIKEVLQGVNGKEAVVSGVGFVKGLRIEYNNPSIILRNLNFKSQEAFSFVIDVAANAPLGDTSFNIVNLDGGSTGFKISVVTRISVSSVSPQSAGQGVNNLELKVKGNNFRKDLAVEVRGDGISVNSMHVLTESEIVLNVSVDEISSAGVKEFTLTSVDGGSCKFLLTVNQKPIVSSVAPATFFQGADFRVVSVSGMNFTRDSQLSFNSPGIIINAAEVKPPSTITANLTFSSNTPPCKYDVSVANSDGGAGILKGGLTVTLKPSVSKIIPASSIQGVFEQDIELYGAGFAEGCSVKVSGEGIVVNRVERISDNRLKLVVTVDSKAPMNFRDFYISNPDGGFFFGTQMFSICKVDKESIYFGDINKFKKPAAVNKQRLFKEHPCYKIIINENVSPDVAKYWLLINRVNDSIKDVYKKIQRKYEYDLVGEVGFIVDNTGSPVVDVPDITDLVIKENEKCDVPR